MNLTPLSLYLSSITDVTNILNKKDLEKILINIEPKYSRLFVKCYEYEFGINCNENKNIYRFFLKNNKFVTNNTEYYNCQNNDIQSIDDISYKIMYLNGIPKYMAVCSDIISGTLLFIDNSNIDYVIVKLSNLTILIGFQAIDTKYDKISRYGIYTYIYGNDNMYDEYTIYNVFEEKNLILCDDILKNQDIREKEGMKYIEIVTNTVFTEYQDELIEILEKKNEEVDIFNIVYNDTTHIIPNRLRLKNNKYDQIIYAVIDKVAETNKKN